MTETQELVVPRSIPIILPMMFYPLKNGETEIRLLSICGERLLFQEPSCIPVATFVATRSPGLGAAGGRLWCSPFAARSRWYWLPGPTAPWRWPGASWDPAFRQPED